MVVAATAPSGPVLTSVRKRVPETQLVGPHGRAVENCAERNRP
ncbi:hypothetical protein ABZ890_47120 [Streptomyces sp. NPDC046984]